MTFLQALGYFFTEAFSNLARSWKVSLLAVLTITVSVFLGGVFLIVSGNLRTLADEWRDESRLVVYLHPNSAETEVDKVRSVIEEMVEGEGVQRVDSETAEARFRDAFPSLGDLLEGWGDQPLPASFEIQVDLDTRDPAVVEAWLARIRGEPATQMVDDDRDWLAQLDAVILIIEGLASVIGVILLVTAVFTIASVIRLTAYLYQDEIAVMRMVGATEFYIRGPFYAEGFLQGLAGGTLAIGMLYSGHGFLFRRAEEDQPALAAILAESFLPPGQLLILVTLGGLAGLTGAVLSLRKETLGQTAETEWQGEE